MSLRIVLDTNIFVSGIHWNGASYKILQAWFDGKFELIFSLEIIDEVIETLKDFKVPLSPEDLRWWENLLLEKATFVNPQEKIDIVTDQDDNKFIEAAVEGSANFIVSNDKHLLVLKEYNNIKIVKADEFLKLLI